MSQPEEPQQDQAADSSDSADQPAQIPAGDAQPASNVPLSLAISLQHGASASHEQGGDAGSGGSPGGNASQTPDDNEEQRTGAEQPQDKKSQDDYKRVVVWRLSDVQVERMTDLFVEPLGFRTQVDDLNARATRIAIIYGPHHTGKFTTAVQFGLKMLDQVTRPIVSQCRITGENLGLLDLVQDKVIARNTVYILEVGQHGSVDLRDLRGSIHLPEANAILKDKQSWLLLTISRNDELDDVVGNIWQLSAVVHDLDAVLTKHVRRYMTLGQEQSLISEQHAAVVETNRAELLKSLQNPFQIDRFCARLSRVEASDTSVKELAEQIGKKDLEVPRQWFERLHFNAQFYAMLITIFPGLDRLVVDELYDRAVRSLRNEGLAHLLDARRFGRDDLLERLNAHDELVDEFSIVRFDNPAFEREALRQVRNYHPLLWSIHPLLCDLIRQYRHRDFWELRRILGAALGRMGVYHSDKLKLVLEELAGDPNGGIVATVGYALEAVSQLGAEWYDFISSLLEGWARSKNFDLMWAVGPSVWRIYGILAQSASPPADEQKAQQANMLLQHLRRLLGAVAGDIDQVKPVVMKITGVEGNNEQSHTFQVQPQVLVSEIESSILHALCRIAESHLEDVVDELCCWLRPRGQEEDQVQRRRDNNRQSIAIKATRQLFGMWNSPNTSLSSDREQVDDKRRHLSIRLEYEQRLPLLKLLDPLLECYTATLSDGANLTEPDSTDVAEPVMPKLGHSQGGPNMQHPVTSINSAFAMLRSWLTWPELSSYADEYDRWRVMLYSRLLRIATSADATCSTLLTDMILMYFIGDIGQPADGLREMGQALIARLGLMRGYPSLLPGQRDVVLLVDGSSRGRNGNAGARLGWGLFTALDPQVDVYFYQMGNCARLAQAGEAPTADLPAARSLPRGSSARTERSRSGTALKTHPLPRLIAPLLDAHSPEQTLCALILGWGIPADLDDLQGSTWSRRLLLALDGGKKHIAALLPELHTQIDPVLLDRLEADALTLSTIERAIRQQIARQVLALDAAAWWRHLAPHLDEVGGDRGATEQRLTAWARQFEIGEETLASGVEEPSTGDLFNYRDSRARRLACAVLWLAASDLRACVDLVERWLLDDAQAARYCGRAFGRMLFRVYTEQERPPLDPVAQLLRLAPHLGDQGWADAAIVFEAARAWSSDDRWADRLANEEEEGGLMRLVLRLCEQQAARHALSLFIKEWIVPPEQRRDRKRDNLARLGEQIALRIQLGAPLDQNVIASDLRCGLVLIDAAVAAEHPYRAILALTASLLLGMLIERPLGDNLALHSYRLGARAPSAVTGEKLAAKTILPDALPRLPRLIGPLLEGYRDEQIVFAVVLTVGQIADADDWEAASWCERIHVAAPVSSAPDHPFTHIELPVLSDQQKGEDWANIWAKTIYENLKRKIGVARWSASSARSVSSSTT